MSQKNTSGVAMVGARDGYNRMVFPHVRLFPHNISENPSYSLPSPIRCTIALIINYVPFLLFVSYINWPNSFQLIAMYFI